jgi:hypothetical protein
MIHCGQRRRVGWIRGARLCRLAATFVFVVAGLMVFGSAGSGAVAGATTTAVAVGGGWDPCGGPNPPCQGCYSGVCPQVIAGAPVETVRTDAVAAEPVRQDAVPGQSVRVPACNGDEPGFAHAAGTCAELADGQIALAGISWMDAPAPGRYG